jgi:nicotinamidase-related amidase
MTQDNADEIQDWSPFVLLLVDVQRDFWTDEIAEAFPDYEDHVTQLLELCRQESIDVVHLRANFQADRSDWMPKYKFLDSIPCIEGTKGAQVLPFAQAVAGEVVLTKQTFDGFIDGELETYLQHHNKRFMLIAGIETSVCVLLTAASAAQKGYLVAVVEDCCADQPSAHEHTLERYPFIFTRTTVGQVAADREQWQADLKSLAKT